MFLQLTRTGMNFGPGPLPRDVGHGAAGRRPSGTTTPAISLCPESTPDLSDRISGYPGE